MTHPAELSRQAADLWLQAASLTWKAATLPIEISVRVADAVCERMLPERERADLAEPVGIAVAEPPRPAGPSQKQRRRAARGEPTRGQAARRRAAQRTVETQAAQETDTARHAGAEVQVAAPWEGYDELSAADVVQRIADEDDTTRAAVRLYEGANQAREAILHATER
jgi:hypothetical protein